jgi:hypothetical protein
MPRMLSRREAATLLQERFGLPCSCQTLARIACERTGLGPPFRKAGGRVFYPEAELVAWGKAQFSPLVRRNTDLPGHRLRRGAVSALARSAKE